MKSAWRQILQQHKLQTRASKVDKKQFASLIFELFQCSMTPEHLKAGFRATGICPFNPKAVPDSKLSSTSVPKTSAATSTVPTAAASTALTETPVRTYLTGYFTELLKPKADKNPSASKNPGQRVRPAYHGEALTQDEIFSRIQEAEEEKQKKKEEQQKKKEEQQKKKEEQQKKKAKKNAGKKRKSKKSPSEQDEVQCAHDQHSDAEHASHDESDENICQGCLKSFDDDSPSEQEEWLGCDKCWRWWHFSCAGFDEMPDTSNPFNCPVCTT